MRAKRPPMLVNMPVPPLSSSQASQAVWGQQSNGISSHIKTDIKAKDESKPSGTTPSTLSRHSSISFTLHDHSSNPGHAASLRTRSRNPLGCRSCIHSPPRLLRRNPRHCSRQNCSDYSARAPHRVHLGASGPTASLAKQGTARGEQPAMRIAAGPSRS